MALPLVNFNASTGSDSAASGAGPGDGTTAGSAVTGTAAAHTGGAASTTITLTNSPDLSGVLTDGSHCLWLKTASGRQFSKITAKGSGTVTVEDSFTIASGSAVDYAIGGKRATFDNADSRTLFASTGAKAGWTIQTETNQTTTSTISLAGAGDTTTGNIVCKASGGTLVVNCTANNTSCLTFASTTGRWEFQGFQFTSTAATKTSSYGLTTSAGSGVWTFRNCTFGDATNKLQNAYSPFNSATVHFLGCTIQNCIGAGISEATSGGVYLYVGCTIKNNGGAGISGTSTAAHMVEDSEIYGNSGDGIAKTGSTTGNVTGLQVRRNTIHGNTGHGINLGSVFHERLLVANNQITGNGGYGISATGAMIDRTKMLIDYNNFGSGSTANTSGAVNSFTQGSNSINVDPGYANAAAGDFTPSNSSVQAGYSYGSGV